MADEKHWCKAIVISLLLHGVLLVGIGLLYVKAFQVQDIPEQYVELDLTGEIDMPEQIAANVAAGSPASVNMPKPNVAAPSIQQHIPVVAVAASSMSVLSVEPGNGSSGEMEAAAALGGSGESVSGNGNASAAGSGGNSTEGKSSGRGFIRPGILSKSEPSYPERARQAGWEGTVILKIEILEDGRSGYVSVYRSSGYDILDDAAIAAIQQWRFIPAQNRDSGQAISCYTTMPVVFRLRS